MIYTLSFNFSNISHYFYQLNGRNLSLKLKTRNNKGKLNMILLIHHLVPYKDQVLITPSTPLVPEQSSTLFLLNPQNKYI